MGWCQDLRLSTPHDAWALSGHQHCTLRSSRRCPLHCRFVVLTFIVLRMSSGRPSLLDAFMWWVATGALFVVYLVAVEVCAAAVHDIHRTRLAVTAHGVTKSTEFEPQGGPSKSHFFLLSVALKDSPQGPPTANLHQPPNATRHQSRTPKDCSMLFLWFCVLPRS